METNKIYCPDCCKEINQNDLLIGIGGCTYCPKNSPFIKSEDKKIYKQQPTEKNPILVDNYPWGFKKCNCKFYIESVKKKGDRWVKQTQNPKTGLWCKPKKSTYCAVMVAYENGEGHATYNGLHRSTDAEDYKKFMEFVGDLQLNELQQEELKVLRAYIKAYENVSFECVEATGWTDEQREKHNKEQEEVKESINKSVAVNYHNDQGSL